MSGDTIAFGATVEIRDLDSGETKKFTLLGPDEADYNSGSISVHSPLAQALLGKEEGEDAIVNAPRGQIEYEIVSVRYNGNKE
jgi:transcription elongation factor GreA